MYLLNLESDVALVHRETEYDKQHLSKYHDIAQESYPFAKKMSESKHNGELLVRGDVKRAWCWFWHVIIVYMIACVQCSWPGYPVNRKNCAAKIPDCTIDQMSKIIHGVDCSFQYKAHEKRYALRNPQNKSVDTMSGLVNPSKVSMWGNKS